MTIKVGDTLPEAEFYFIGEDGRETISISDLCKGKKTVLFGLPGAFTPTCHANHLPGFLKHLDEIKAKGIAEVGVISVNDMHVMNAWAEATGGKGKIRFLADGSADFTKAIGMDVDLGTAGMGIRSKRYSMVVENGKVTSLNIEQAPGTTELSGAAAILNQL